MDTVFDHKKWPIIRQGDDPGGTGSATDFRSPALAAAGLLAVHEKKNIRAEPPLAFFGGSWWWAQFKNTWCVWWWKKDPCSWCLHIWKYCNVARISTTFAMLFFWLTKNLSLVEGIKCEPQLQVSLQFSPQQLQTPQYIYIIIYVYINTFYVRGSCICSPVNCDYQPSIISYHFHIFP